MMPIPGKNRSGAQGLSARHAAGMLCNEGGFVLVFVMFLLAVCTLLGLAASQTSIDEINISGNEVVMRKVYTMALSGLPLATIPLLTTQGRGVWDTSGGPVYIDNNDPTATATSGSIQVLDGQFLLEGREEDAASGTGWNNSGKYSCNGKIAAYKPIDDPFQQRKADGTVYDTSIGSTPDLQIRTDDLLTLDIDVDKVSVKHLKGGVAEFASGAEGSTGEAVKINYVFDCMATVPGRDIKSAKSPTAEIVLNYRFVPNSGM